MKLDELGLSLLFDYYGDLLTEKQRTCFDLYYNQDLSLSEIAQEAGISRQGVYDSLSRAEAALRTMEAKTGAAARDTQCRQAMNRVRLAAKKLLEHPDPQTRALALEILEAADTMKE